MLGIKRGLAAAAGVVLVSVLAVSLATAQDSRARRNGFVDVPGGRVWYEIMGQGEATPLLVLHGGPGGRSCGYLHYLAELADDRPVVIYDQLDSGRSDRPNNPANWEVSRFVDELAAVRKSLDLKEMHLLGQSWGGSLALEYIAVAGSDGIKSLILASPLVDTARWIEDAKSLRRDLPLEDQRALDRGDETGDFSSPEYLAATQVFYERHLSLAGWPPEPVPECDGSGGFNATVYESMWGPNEFTASGVLKTFDRSALLRELDMPVLLIAGRFDEARPETMAAYYDVVPDSELIVIEDSAHALHVDQQARFIEAVGNYLRMVDAR